MMCHRCSQLPTESGYHPWSAIPHLSAVARLLGLAATPTTPSPLLVFMLRASLPSLLPFCVPVG